MLNWKFLNPDLLPLGEYDPADDSLLLEIDLSLDILRSEFYELLLSFFDYPLNSDVLRILFQVLFISP